MTDQKEKGRDPLESVGNFYSVLVSRKNIEVEMELDKSKARLVFRKILMSDEVNMREMDKKNAAAGKSDICREADMLEHQLQRSESACAQRLVEIADGAEPNHAETRAISSVLRKLVRISIGEATEINIDEMVCYIGKTCSKTIGGGALSGLFTRKELEHMFIELKMQELENIAIRSGVPLSAARSAVRGHDIAATDEQQTIITKAMRQPAGNA